ncbi:transmembrane protein 254-like [Paramacrobiotus metropolitanus]|uniref:transmembrane protein 254-like n=1 Tax=Paramacrobiotus metropolitanus TaxID=2943436 RepID=UPI002446035D|nr:transmembrane protein 254-like [Paramacrobiotus metropolitanus]
MKRTFFQMAEPRWMFTIAVGLGMLLWSWLAPSSIPGPYGLYLGPVGMLGRFLGENFPHIVSSIVYVATFLHIGEALYAAKLCWDQRLTVGTSLKWVLQTFLFGFASLRILRSRTRTA